MNLESSIRRGSHGGGRPALILLAAFIGSLMLASCSKTPEQYRQLGMKAFVAGEYAKAQKYFSEGIEKEGTRELYAGFIAANLVTGKYPQINSAYNRFCSDIHDSLVSKYGQVFFMTFGIATKLIPYKIDGANRLPPDFPQIVALQESVDFDGYVRIKGQIDSIVRK